MFVVLSNRDVSGVRRWRSSWGGGEGGQGCDSRAVAHPAEQTSGAGVPATAPGASGTQVRAPIRCEVDCHTAQSVADCSAMGKFSCSQRSASKPQEIAAKRGVMSSHVGRAVYILCA